MWALMKKVVKILQCPVAAGFVVGFLKYSVLESNRSQKQCAYNVEIFA